MGRISRRTFLAGAAFTAAGCGAYMRWFEAQRLVVTFKQAVLRHPHLVRKVRILHLADLHLGPHVALDFIEQAIERGLEQKPDLLLLTGDFFTKQCTLLNEYAAVLGSAARRVPAFACAGNHDGGIWAKDFGGHADLKALQKLLADSGIAWLHNSAQQVEAAGQKLQLVGLADWWDDAFKPSAAFQGLNHSAPVIVLSHNPDSKQDLSSYAWDLMLSGHTHGGQCRLPFLGAPFAPVRDRSYIEGLLPWGERLIHITRGVGNLYGLRFNCPPEVSLLDLVSG